MVAKSDKQRNAGLKSKTQKKKEDLLREFEKLTSSGIKPMQIYEALQKKFNYSNYTCVIVAIKNAQKYADRAKDC